MPRTTVTGKRQITLPVEVCRILGLRQGDRLTVEVVGDEIHLKREQSSVLRPLRGNSSLFKFIGVAKGPADLAENHDKYLAEEEHK